MGLSIEDRGRLEKIIDARIEETPELVKFFRLPENKMKYQVKDENEFVFALSFGYIVGTFEKYYENVMGKSLVGIDLDEVMGIIEKRLREIKDSLFEAG